jgi:LytTr DNA-binding domain
MAGIAPHGNGCFANRRGSFVNDTTLSLTLRRWRELMLSRRAQALVAVIAVAAAIIGPFGTVERLSFGRRLVYWSGVVVSHTVIAVLILLAVSFALRNRTDRRWLRLAAGGVAASLPLGILQMGLAYVLEGASLTMANGVEIWLSTLTITLAVTAIVGLARGEPQAPVQAPLAAPGPPARSSSAFLDRLPITVGRELVSLSMQDHYIDVRTSTGHALLLMRLSDAIKELEGIDGLQIHRSHWVAKAAVARLVPHGGRLQVELLDGRTLPVSRSFATAVKGAGLPQ